MKRFFIFASALFFICTGQMKAQNVNNDMKIRRSLIKSEQFEKFQNVSFLTLFNDEKSVYSVRSLKLVESKNYKGYTINPTGSTFAFVNKDRVVIYNLSGSINTMKDKSISLKGNTPEAVVYSADARFLNIIDNTGIVHVLSIENKYTEERSFQLKEMSRQLEMSGNNYFLTATNDKIVRIYNYENGEMRKMIETDSHINAVRFNSTSTQMAVACSNGTVSIYDTKDFKLIQTLDGLVMASDVAFHEEGKYLAVVIDDSNINLVNLKKPTEIHNISLASGVSQVRLLRSTEGEDLLYTKEGQTNNGNAAFVFVTLSDLLPYYTNQIIDELNARLDDWTKMRPDETAEQYRLRVNDETRAAEARRIENEIATRLAGDMVSLSTISVVGYNRDNGMLTMNLDNLNDVYLEMPEEDVLAFGNPEDLVFSDVVYGVNSEDSFEIIYAKVYNKSNGKTYTFDNLNRESLAFLAGGNNFVDIELVQQANMEDVILQGFKEEVVENAKAQKLISDHTNISVNTSVEPAFDANGNKITNYNVDFKYQVESEFSAKDDFAAGRYRIEQSAAATSMLTIAKKAFEKDFAQYIKEGKKVVISVTGSADALPINGKIQYDGCYGNFADAPYYLNGELKSVSVSKASGITQNEQLAFLRAQGVKAYLQKEMPQLNKMNTEFRTNVELAAGTGGEYRRIHVRFTFVDAF